MAKHEHNLSTVSVTRVDLTSRQEFLGEHYSSPTRILSAKVGENYIDLLLLRQFSAPRFLSFQTIPNA